MKKEILKSPPITAFTPDGDYLAILSSNGTLKIWSTRDGSLLAEWKDPDGKNDVGYSCMACCFQGKKRKNSYCVVAVGTNSGDVLAVNASNGERKWVSAGCHLGGVIGLSFANKGRRLHAVGSNGKVSEMDTETGNIIKEFKASKKSISSSSFSLDEKYLAVAGKKLKILSKDDGDELMVHPDKLGPVKLVSLSDDAKTIITSELGAKHLQVWWCDMSAGKLSRGPVLSMKHPPFVSECRNVSNQEDNVVVLSVSVSGVAYLWKLKILSEDEVSPTKVSVKANDNQSAEENHGSAKKNRVSVIASRINGVGDNEVSVLVTHGSMDLPQHSLFSIGYSVKEDVNTARGNKTLQQNDDCSEQGPHEVEQEVVTPKSKKGKKKRAASDLDSLTTGDISDVGNGDASDVIFNDDLNEPSMGEKLASLNLVDQNEDEGREKEPSVPAIPPSADSVQVLLKQALHAEDRVLLLECLYTKDDKVISKSIAQLNSSDVLKLLHSLISFIQSRGAILVCVLPWLRGLLLQHASKIMSQESSLLALNSLYQLIESRISTFQSALLLSSSLDFLYSGVLDEEVDENDAIVPIIYEEDDSDDKESGDEMETDEDEERDEVEAFDDLSAGEVDDDMSE
ncbi:WD repeat-containing protein 43 [Benincasa hispida]|uniref:WD repeat-containing protein 43 n=1 Tax=Benincasa hispida TaxID=102211 RepID=UPI0019014FDF|nr:WD repeat-containing protein 43 [Benincasa hispida]